MSHLFVLLSGYFCECLLPVLLVTIPNFDVIIQIKEYRNIIFNAHIYKNICRNSSSHLFVLLCMTHIYERFITRHCSHLDLFICAQVYVSWLIASYCILLQVFIAVCHAWFSFHGSKLFNTTSQRDMLFILKIQIVYYDWRKY